LRPIERVETALRGAMPDRVPVVPIYDLGYILKLCGADPRKAIIGTPDERAQYVETAFLQHDVDGYFVHTGSPADRYCDKRFHVQELEKHWLVTDEETGERFRLMPDGTRRTEDGSADNCEMLENDSSAVDGTVDVAELIPLHSEEYYESIGRLAPLRRMRPKYPDHHLSVQIGSPMVRAINSCGGYVSGLTVLASDRGLLREMLARHAENEKTVAAAAAKAGADSVWFTSYYTGADTISPRDYREVVFPYEYDVCQFARECGLFVLDWFLGDLMPILDKLMELPIDALVLEQGRKGYDTDPVEIRRRVGETLCLFGYALEGDFCTFNIDGLRGEFARQFNGAGRNGAFVAGTPIMPPDAQPEAVDSYFDVAREIGRYE
jgi:hypothetical protein